jgi:hypothetical protein
MAREIDAAHFQKLFENAHEDKQDKQYYNLFLVRQIESIELIQKSRKLCETFKLD